MRNIFRATIGSAILAGAFTMSASAQAAATVCTAGQLANVAGATACVYDVGNINSNSPADRAAQAILIGMLGAPTFTYVDVSNSNNSFNNGWGQSSLSPVSFGVPMMGETIVSFHFGNGANSPFGTGHKGGGVTAFYLMNFAVATNSLSLTNTNSLSNAQLFATGAVPEPSAWALLILGFGLVGGTMRSRRRTVAAAF